MLSPKRAILPPWASCQAHAARAQTPSRCNTSPSCQCPTTTLRASRIRLQMNPNSRQPCADWFRFMKSMSIVDQGMSRLNCVCRCANGLFSVRNPAIHILAGENVCIQAISPMQFGARFASRQTSLIACGVVRTGLKTTLTGISAESASDLAMIWECSATLFNVSSPYKCWLPVTNQTSNGCKSIILRILPRRLFRIWRIFPTLSARVFPLPHFSVTSIFLSVLASDSSFRASCSAYGTQSTCRHGKMSRKADRKMG